MIKACFWKMVTFAHARGVNSYASVLKKSDSGFTST